MENSTYNTGNNKMQHPFDFQRFRVRTLMFGALVILAGILLLARNTGLLDPSVSRIIFSWEMLLIAIGAVNLFHRHSLISGIILISIGLFFLLVNFYHMPFNTWQIFWPGIIILIGLSLIFKPKFQRHRHEKWDFVNKNMEYTNDYINDLAVFGGSELRLTTQDFKGGEIVAVFGGSKIDLTQCAFPENSNPSIELVAVFGGSTLLVPSDWNVKSEVFSLFGGYADKRITTQINPAKTLIVKGVAIFGGGEIKSY